MTLGYDLELCHIAVCVESGARRPDDWISGVRARCQVRDTVDFPAGDGFSVWWFGRHTWTEDGHRLLLDELGNAGLLAEVSDQASGLRGFRMGYRQLMQARVIRAGWARTQETDRRFGAQAAPAAPVLSFGDVRVEAMFLDHLDTVAGFVRRELGDLAAPITWQLPSVRHSSTGWRRAATWPPPNTSACTSTQFAIGCAGSKSSWDARPRCAPLNFSSR